MHKISNTELSEATIKQLEFFSMFGAACAQHNSNNNSSPPPNLPDLSTEGYQQLLKDLQKMAQDNNFNNPARTLEDLDNEEDENDVVKILSQQLSHETLNVDTLNETIATQDALYELQNKDRKSQQKYIHKAIQNVEAMIDIMDEDKHDGRDLVKFCLKHYNGFVKAGEGKCTYNHYSDNDLKAMDPLMSSLSAGKFATTKKTLNEIREAPFTDRLQDEALCSLSTSTTLVTKNLQYRYDLLANKKRRILNSLGCTNTTVQVKTVSAAMEKIFILEQTGAPQDRGIEHFMFNDFIRLFGNEFSEQSITQEHQSPLAILVISWAQILKTRCAVAGNFTPVALKISKMRNSKCNWQTLWHNTHLFQEQLVALIPKFWKDYTNKFSSVAQALHSSIQIEASSQLNALIAFHLETTGKISDDEYAALNATAIVFAAAQTDVKLRVDLILGTVDRILFFHNKQQRLLRAFNVVQTNDMLQYAFETIQDNLGDKFTEKDVVSLFARWKQLVAPDFHALLTACLDVLEIPTEVKIDVGRFIWQQTECTALYYLYTNQEEKAIHFVDAFNVIVPKLMKHLESAQGKNKRKKRFPKTVLPALKEELRKLKELQLQQEQQQISKDNTAKLSKNARKRLLYKQQRTLEEKYAVDLSNVTQSIAVSKKELEQNRISHEERVQRKAELKAARVNDNNSNSNHDCSIEDNNDNEQASEQSIKPTYLVTKKEYEIFEGIINYSTKISSESAQFKSLMFKIFNMQFRQGKGSHCVGVSTGIRLPDLIDLGNGNIIPLSSFSTELTDAIVRGGDSNATWITTCSKYLRKYQLCQIRKSMFERGWALDTVSIG